MRYTFSDIAKRLGQNVSTEIIPNVSRAAFLGRQWPGRFGLLDGLRGLASLSVLLHHLGASPLGHYAVMVFFVISGYCITASAQSSLQRQPSFLSFIRRRARRIYPPYLLAVTFFAVTRWVRSYVEPGKTWHPTWTEWLQNLTLTQWTSLPFHPIAWPSANPRLFVSAFWSLNYEEQFYLVVAVGLVFAARLNVPLLRTVSVLFVIGLVWNVLTPGNWITGIFIEYWAHFALGALLFLVLCTYPSSAPRWAFLFGSVLLGVICATRLLSSSDADVQNSLRAYFELGLLATFSFSLLLLRPYSDAITRSMLWKPIAALGAISYSLYLVQQFNLTVVAAVAHQMLPDSCPRYIQTLMLVVLHLCIASVFWYFCERPFISKYWLGRSNDRPSAKVTPTVSIDT